MNYLEGLNLQNFITPAIIIAIIAYFIKFFGRIISDQKPFSDDRGWEIELNGFYFVLNLFFIGSFGIALSFLFPIKINSNIGHFIILILVLILGTIPLLTGLAMMKKNYKISSSKLDRLLDNFKLNNKAIIILSAISSLIITPALFYLIALELINFNVLWFTIISSEKILILILLALNYSLSKYKPMMADIYFTNGNEPLINMEILKINSDNIRLRKDNKIIILSKHLVSKIESNLKSY